MGVREAMDLQTGNTFKVGNDLFQIVKYEYKNNGRNGGVINMKVRNLDTGSFTESSYRASDRLDQIILDRKKMDFLYENGGSYTFMDQENYEQVEITNEEIGDASHYLLEGMPVQVIMYGNRHIGIELPEKIEIKVEYTEPAVKGDTSGKVLKAAKLETGLEIKVPAYIEIGEMIRVDTRDGTFVERVK